MYPPTRADRIRFKEYLLRNKLTSMVAMSCLREDAKNRVIHPYVTSHASERIPMHDFLSVAHALLSNAIAHGSEEKLVRRILARYETFPELKKDLLWYAQKKQQLQK